MSGTITPSLTGLIVMIGENGPVVPAFETILTGMITFFQSIYGEDIYLGNDSQDMQLIGVFSNALNDLNSAVVAAYNSFSPATAQGTGLSSNVKINGLRRDVATNSTAVLTLTGNPNGTITAGQINDVNNYTWLLPASVQLNAGGTAQATATCSTIGAIAAGPGTITSIQNLQSGWATATNAQAATVGAPVESDPQLRTRQSTSTALSSLTSMQALESAVGNLLGVQTVVGYENDTSTANSLGIPANCIAMVVAGGTASEIALTIFDYKAPGIPTYGNTTVSILDSQNVPRSVSYSVPTQQTIGVNITLTPGPTYSATVAAEIQNAVSTYVGALEPGSNVSWSKTLGAALLLGNPDAATFDITALTLSLNGGASQASDIQLLFNQEPACSPANVTVTP